jgi:hypothetical protein
LNKLGTFNNNNNNNNKKKKKKKKKKKTIYNYKPDLIIRDNEKRICILIDVAVSGDRNVIKKEAEMILKYEDLTTAHVECKNKVDTGNNWSDWNYFKIIQKIREQHSRKPRS